MKIKRRTIRRGIIPAGRIILLLLAGAFLFTGGVRAGEVLLSQKPAAVITLPGDLSCHTQGVDLAGGFLFVSCVERKSKRALVLRYTLGGDFPAGDTPVTGPEITDVTRAGMHHPSGLDHDGRCLWVAAAHYRSFLARSEISCLDPKSMDALDSFMVDDHIGTIAVMGDQIVGMNWDSKLFHRFDRTGALLGKDPAPTGVGYQDCRGLSADSILCSGTQKREGKPLAVVDLLSFDGEAGAWFLAGRWLLGHAGTSLGREGFTVLDDGRFLFLPEDFPGARLFVFPGAPLRP